MLGELVSSDGSNNIISCESRCPMGMRTGLHWNRTCSCPITRHVDFASCVHVMPHSTAQIRVKRVTCHLPCPRQLNKTRGEDSVTSAASPLFQSTRLTDPVCLSPNRTYETSNTDGCSREERKV